MKKELRILKIGGNVLADDQLLDTMLTTFANWTGPAILVHGGGRSASEFSRRLGIEAKMIDGRRITDAPTLDVVTMVYAGLVNKKIVAALQAKNCNALGLSGADANVIRAHKRKVTTVDYGFAGDIDEVDDRAIKALLEAGFSPVCCPITHNRQGQLLNTNADTIASALAVALARHYSVSLRYCFEKPGVLRNAEDDSSQIAILSSLLYQELKQKGLIHSGMLPKLDNAFGALEKGVREVLIGNPTSLQSGEATQVVG